MSLPPDLVAFLEVLLRGALLAAQCLSVGGVVFLLALATPLAPRFGGQGERLRAATLRHTATSGLALAIVALGAITLETWSLMGDLGLSAAEALGADAIRWTALSALAGLALSVSARGGRRLGLVLSAAAVILASVMSGHAAARLDDQAAVMAADILHQAGAAIWIGGIPFMLLGFRLISDREARWRLGLRFSHISMAGVGILAAGAAGLALTLIHSWGALIGTAYGAMTLTKAGLLGVLLLFGLMNMLSVRAAMAGGIDGGFSRLRRFAETEIGIGITVLFVAASLGSQPPGADQTADRASVAEIVERFEPHWPRLVSPSHDAISVPDSAAAATIAATEADMAWSEFNHNWSGILVLLIGLAALAERAGLRAARHWPLLFIGLAGMLFVRSDPETWPLGPIGFFDRLADPEVMQHRLLNLLIVVFALFEWAVRLGMLKRPGAQLVFPLLCAVGGALLLTHNHSLTDVKQRYLIELTHLPMGMFGIIAGWTRWLELRAEGWPRRAAGWVWPVCFMLIGLLLIDYREM